jgi:hypothetical protein
MSDNTCICGDIDAPHTEADHVPKRSWVPAIFVLALGALGIRHARQTGNCMCGDIVKEFTGKRPKGAK